MSEEKLSAILITTDEKLRFQVAGLLEDLHYVVAPPDQIDAVCQGQLPCKVVVVDEGIRADECWAIHTRNPGSKLIRITNSWPDEKNYRWLRDVAGVATQLLQPLNEKFFKVMASAGSKALSEETGRSKNSGTECGTTAIPEPSSACEAVASVQNRLRAEVLREWDQFEQSVVTLTDRRLPTNMEMASLIKPIHQIRGSSGSLNLMRLSRCAALIEDWLRLFIPCSEPDMVLLCFSLREQILSVRPFIAEQAAIPRSYQAVDSSDADKPPISVLAIGDNEDQVAEIESLFVRPNIELYGLTIPVNVLDEVELLRPHLVSINSALTSVSVFDVCRELRSHSAFKETAIACLMSRPHESFEASDLPAGVFCIRKPSDEIDEREWEMYLSGLRPR